MLEKVPNELQALLTKVIIPALIAVGVKLAIEMKKNKNKITWCSAFLSMIIGVGMAYLTSGLVRSYFSDDMVPIIIGLIAILSEKFGEYLIYKFNVDVFISALLNHLLDAILKFRNNGK